MANLITPACLTAGPTITAATPASCIPTSCPLTLDPGYWELGKRWRIRLSGKISSSILDGRGTLNQSPGSARFDLRLGGQVVWDSLAIPLNSSGAFTAVPWCLEVEVTCQSIGVGTAATLLGEGKFICADIDGASITPPAAGGIAVVPWATTPAAGPGFNSFARLDVDVYFSQTVGTGSLTVLYYAISELV